MTHPGAAWNEANLSELPEVEHLQRLGYEYVGPETLDAERESLKEVVLTRRLSAALKRLNPWMSVDNLQKAVRAVTHVHAASLIEASEQVHTTLAYGLSLGQDRGDGKTSYDVRFFDFDAPERNQFVVTQQFTVKGTKKKIRPDLVLFVNGIPLVVIECQSPTLGEGWKKEATEQFSRYQELDERYHLLGAPKLCG